MGPDGAVPHLDPRLLELFGLGPDEVAALELAPAGRRGPAVRAALAGRAADPEACARWLGADRPGAGADSLEVPLADGRVLELRSAPRHGADGAAAGRVFLARDVTAQRRAERERGERARQQEALAMLGQAALTARDAAPFLERLAGAVAATLGVEVVRVLACAGDRRHFTVRGATEAAAGLGAPDALRDDMAARALATAEPVVCGDLARETRFESAPLRALGLASGVAAVIGGPDAPYGALQACARRPRRFAPEEVQFVEAAAHVAGGVLARCAAEAALRDHERQLRAVVDHGLDGVLTFTEGEGIVEANPAACRVLGRAREELLRAPVAGILGSTARLARDRADGRARGELELLPAAGPPRRVEYATVADILPGLHLVLLRDVTEKRAMQERLTVADRMASVGTFAAGVAHELNNPLAYVAANLGWVSEELGRRLPPGPREPWREELDRAVSDALSGAERMRGIIRDLRTFSRSDEAHTMPVDVPALLEACLHLAGKELEHRARLVRELAAVPPVMANEARLGQVFLNLVVNATQALPEGAPDRHLVRVACRPCPDGRVAVEVEDTGCGIGPEVRARIFDPFFTTKPPGVGTGLGLSICHNVVTALGGEIEVESPPGRGALFRVLLPAWERPLARPAEAPASCARRGRVLVVDDEPAVAAALRRALQDEHDVTTASCAAEALAHVDAGDRFDLVVSDLLMPDGSGVDLHRVLRERAPELADRTLFVTGGAYTDEARAFVAEHRDRCLEKPFDLQLLRERIRRELSAGVGAGVHGVPSAPGRERPGAG